MAAHAAEKECCRLLPRSSSLSAFTGFLTSKVSTLNAVNNVILTE